MEFPRKLWKNNGNVLFALFFSVFRAPARCLQYKNQIGKDMNAFNSRIKTLARTATTARALEKYSR